MPYRNLALMPYYHKRIEMCALQDKFTWLNGHYKSNCHLKNKWEREERKDKGKKKRKAVKIQRSYQTHGNRFCFFQRRLKRKRKEKGNGLSWSDAQKGRFYAKQNPDTCFKALGCLLIYWEGLSHWHICWHELIDMLPRRYLQKNSSAYGAYL